MSDGKPENSQTFEELLLSHQLKGFRDAARESATVSEIIGMIQDTSVADNIGQRLAQLRTAMIQSYDSKNNTLDHLDLQSAIDDAAHEVDIIISEKPVTTDGTVLTEEFRTPMVINLVSKTLEEFLSSNISETIKTNAAGRSA